MNLAEELKAIWPEGPDGRQMRYRYAWAKLGRRVRKEISKEGFAAAVRMLHAEGFLLNPDVVAEKPLKRPRTTENSAKPEELLYGPVFEWLAAHALKQVPDQDGAFDHFIDRTHFGSPGYAGSNPDFLLIFPKVSTSGVQVLLDPEVVSIEVKNASASLTQAISQTTIQANSVNRAILAVHFDDRFVSAENIEQARIACAAQGLGFITFRDEGDDSTYVIHGWGTRRSIAVLEKQNFLKVRVFDSLLLERLKPQGQR